MTFEKSAHPFKYEIVGIHPYHTQNNNQLILAGAHMACKQCISSTPIHIWLAYRVADKRYTLLAHACKLINPNIHPVGGLVGEGLDCCGGMPWPTGCASPSVTCLHPHTYNINGGGGGGGNSPLPSQSSLAIHAYAHTHTTGQISDAFTLIKYQARPPPQIFFY